MGKHSIRFKITVLFAGIICILIVMLLLFNITFSEKFYMQDKQEAMLNAYESIDDACNQYSSGSISDTDLRNNLEQVSTSKGMSIIIVNSDWTTFYVSTHGDEMMLERLKKSIFNNDIFQGMPDKSGSMQEQPDENRNGDINAGKKTLPEKIIDMSGNGASETRDILYQSDKYTVQKVYDSRLLDDYIELWGTLDNGNFILIRTPIQGIKDNVHISNTFITYIGIVTLIIGIIAAFVLSSYISKPIKQLSNIAERMSELDFDIKYDGKDKGEIGLLGKSMNNMSQKLEENISQLKTANLELQRDIDKKEKLEKMRTDFLSNVSHELKTPIALIQGYAEGLKEGITDDPESMDFYCSVIMDEAAKMNNMVKQLLTLNQLESGNDPLTIERFDIAKHIGEIARTNKIRAQQKNAEILYECNDPVYVWADQFKIEEVITNYISNAINHVENADRESSYIKIWLEYIDSTKKKVRIHVFNTGKHIPEDDIGKIWDKFYKVDKARTREYGGSGVGLSIVKAIMNSHGQNFGAENVENGVDFWFELDCENA